MLSAIEGTATVQVLTSFFAESVAMKGLSEPSSCKGSDGSSSVRHRTMPRFGDSLTRRPTATPTRQPLSDVTVQVLMSSMGSWPQNAGTIIAVVPIIETRGWQEPTQSRKLPHSACQFGRVLDRLPGLVPGLGVMRKRGIPQDKFPCPRQEAE